MNTSTSGALAPYTEMTMLRYAITSRVLFPGNEARKQAALLEQAARWIAAEIDFIQLREKDLPASALSILSVKLLNLNNLNPTRTSILINSRPDVAIATGAHGVHLTSSPGELTPDEVRALYASTALPPPRITASCHTLDEVHRAHRARVDAILFAPVFEKSLPALTLPGHGLDHLRAACTAAAPIPVFALGGVTPANTPACLEAGASGIAGIRLFHDL
jgi:thiamine-phosphate pyrophosphorylase